MRVVTADEMRALDRRTIDELGIPGIVLMEHAGRTVAAEIERRLAGTSDDHSQGTVLVCAYKGNNGGDGFVVARLLTNSGFEVEVALFCHPAELSGDAQANYRLLEAFEVEVESYDTAGLEWADRFRRQVARASVIVDALLGTGIRGAVRPPLNQVIDIMNDRGAEHGVMVVAVDLPSGLDTDRGTFDNVCVAADVTVTMALPKLGLVTYPGRELAGELVVADISVPWTFVDELEPQRELLEYGYIGSLLLARAADAHKGTFGKAYVVAGSPGFTGAATLSGTAALRAGTGLVTVGAPEPVHDILEAKLTEVMTEPLGADPDGRVAPPALPAIVRRLESSDAIAIGPGLGRGAGVTTVVTKILEEAGRRDIPVIVDADGLNALADSGEAPAGLEAVKASGARVVLTPHPGELGRLLGQSPGDIQADRVGHAVRAAELSGSVVVLKGAGTVIADPSGATAINTTGNQGLASGGTGDVLTGIIVGLAAQGIEPFDAACAGVFIHGLAADLAAEDMGERAMVAGNVIDYMGAAFRKLAEH